MELHFAYAAHDARIPPTRVLAGPDGEIWLGCVDAALSSRWLLEHRVLGFHVALGEGSSLVDFHKGSHGQEIWPKAQ